MLESFLFIVNRPSLLIPSQATVATPASAVREEAEERAAMPSPGVGAASAGRAERPPRLEKVAPEEAEESPHMVRS